MRDLRLSRRSFLAAGLAAAGAAACQQTRAKDPAAAAEPPRAPRTVPIEYDAQGMLLISARIDDHEPVSLIFDTGASRSTLSSAYAAKLGLPLSAGGEVEGTAGVAKASETTADLEIEGLGRETLEFLVYDLGPAAWSGILGHDYLHRAPFQIRYRERSLVWNAVLPEKRLPLTLDGNIPRITILVNGISTDVRIDTGASLAPSPDAYLNLTRAQADRAGVTGSPVQVFRATGTGGATLELPVHRLQSLVIAGARLPRPFVIVQPPVGYFARAEAVGFLGNSVLDKLDPCFDYEARAFAIGE